MNYKNPAELKKLYDIGLSIYIKEHKRMKLLDATDKGDLWKALKTKFPGYQILPDTNHVAYVKNNILASNYTVMKAAEVLPTSEKDKDITMYLNIALDQVWNLSDVGYYQFRAGERAALLNYALTQVGWDEELSGGSGSSFYKGNVTLKNISPMKFMRDPFAVDLDTSGWCCTYDTFHKSVFEANPLYAKEYKNYCMKRKTSGDPMPITESNTEVSKSGAKDYDTLVVFWVKDSGKIREIHTVNCDHILHVKEELKPNMFPFAELYCNEPAGSLIGSSEPAKIFASSVAANLLDSIAATAEYKNQRPPKFISSQAGLNIQAFAKHGDEADKTFIVNGKAQDAVHYHQFPTPSPVLPAIKDNLQYGIQMVSGVDGRYTGRDTGSIITTGGTEEMLNRVTVIDTPKIIGYERYAKRLTQLILANLIHYAPKRKYFVKKPNTTQWDTFEVDFPSINNDTLFNYQISISSELPKNKQRIAQMANMMMEKQMQYQQQGSSVQLITEEEWLMMQDLPNKEYMLDRMGIQRLQDATEEVSQVLFQYANLVKNGMSPDDAIMATADSLKNKRMGMMPEEGPIPMVANEGAMPPEGAPPMME